MSFAEKIIEGMVDENGCCGDRGMSEKQFDALVKPLHFIKTLEHQGGWDGDYRSFEFSKDVFAGTIGRYNVIVDVFHHFNNRYEVIDVRPWIDELPDFSNSQYVSEVGKRDEYVLTLVRASSFEREPFYVNYYNRFSLETVYTYTFMDAQGNLLYWQTTKEIKDAQAGDIYTIKGTVKEHREKYGNKQTVLTRCKVLDTKKVEQPSAIDILNSIYCMKEVA